MAEKVERCCGNCKYFCRFYNKLNLRYQPIGIGRCDVNDDMRKRKFKSPENTACEFWEQCENKQEKRVLAVTKVIRDIHKQLDRIEQVLYDEEIDRQ